MAQLDVSSKRYAAQVAQERQTAEGMITPAMTPEAVYDPVDLYVKLAREFHWCHPDMDEMDYVLLFSYVDRLSRQHEQESEEHERRMREARAGGSNQQEYVDIGELAPSAVPYEGEVVPLG